MITGRKHRREDSHLSFRLAMLAAGAALTLALAAGCGTACFLEPGGNA